MVFCSFVSETSRRLEIRFEVSVSSRSCNPKSRLGLGPLRLESRSRHCSDVSKVYRGRKYVMVFRNNSYLYIFLAIRSHALFKFAISHSRIEPWLSLCMAIKKPRHRMKCSRNYTPVFISI